MFRLLQCIMLCPGMDTEDSEDMDDSEDMNALDTMYDMDDMEGMNMFRNPWATYNEKSAAARGREETAASKFDFLRSQINMALIENTRVMIGLGCHIRSYSPLKLLSSELVDHIWGYVGMEKPAIADVATGRSGLAIVPYEGWRPWRRNAVEPEDIDVNLADMNMYTPGEKITIPFTKPNLHLTGPCYRDLRKHVKDFPGWDIRRTPATPQEKMEYKEHRRGKVYFVNVIYNVAGKDSKRKRSRKTDPFPVPLSPMQQVRATSALEYAVQSAGINGSVDPVCLQWAVDAGYSKHFVLIKAAEHWGAMKDTKPPAKRTKTEK